MNLNIPDFKSDSNILNIAYRVAVGDIAGNISLYKSGLLEREEPCLIAGLDYNTPWTRDTSINVWNALGILSPDIAKNTLLSVCAISENKEIIGIGYNQYWDCIMNIVLLITIRTLCFGHMK